MVAARVTPAEHAAWREKAAAAGVSPNDFLPLGELDSILVHLLLRPLVKDGHFSLRRDT